MRIAIAALAAAMSLSACAMSPEGQGAVSGGLLGGLAGAIIGNNTGDGDAEQGAAIGYLMCNNRSTVVNGYDYRHIHGLL
jgi:uncharacterized protein YcfJ